MSYELLKSLFQLMTKEQIMEVQDILAEDDEDGDLIREIMTTGYSPLITSMISSRNAEKLIAKLTEYNLEGYMAICKKSNSLERGLTTAIDSSRHTDEDPYQWIERIEKETDVNPYFIAVGDSLEQLIQDINKKSRTK